MATWLYPISKRSNNDFDLADGEKVKVSLPNFKELTFNGRLIEDSWWHVSKNYDKINVGDKVYIYTGDGDTGIIGFSTVRGKATFKGKKTDTKKIDLYHDLMKNKLLIENPISAKIIRQWFIPRNAVMNLENYCEELEQLLPWNEMTHINKNIANFAEIESTSSSGQGFQNSQEVRSAIEKYSMRKATEYFKYLGYDVLDVSLTHSYDLYCSKAGIRLLVEVKGTQSDGAKVFLTKNEVLNAAENKGAVSLYVLSSIIISGEGSHVVAEGGTEQVIHPWDIETGTLTPVLYEYKLPS